MSSRYLATLNEYVERAGNEGNLLYRLAERSAYLARLGKTDAAREDIDFVRARSRADGDGRLAILLNFADGLCHYYQNMGDESRDRLARAYALSVATGNLEMAARAAAWLALLAYGRYDFPRMSKYLLESRKAKSDDLISMARNSLTIALTIHLANRYDLAQEWYRRSRISASMIEDDAMISALLHNMASIWVTNIRNAELGGLQTSDRSAIASAGLASTQNFDDMIGTTSQPILTPLARAQLLSCEGRYVEALELYEQNIAKLELDSVQGWQTWLLADRAWCLLSVGAAEGAKNEFGKVRSMISESDHTDDRAATLQRLAMGYRLLGDEPCATELAALAAEGWRDFRGLQLEMLSATSAFSAWLKES